jgi:hypothetical protein
VGTETTRESGQELVNLASNWRESHTVNTTGHEKLRNCEKTSDRIKPIELDYLVAALVDAVHSLRRGRKPRGRVTRSKRARSFYSKDAGREDAHRSPAEGRKPRWRVDTSREKTSTERNKNSLTRLWRDGQAKMEDEAKAQGR